MQSVGLVDLLDMVDMLDMMYLVDMNMKCSNMRSLSQTSYKWTV